jgi:hypothetical protein
VCAVSGFVGRIGVSDSGRAVPFPNTGTPPAALKSAALRRFRSWHAACKRPTGTTGGDGLRAAWISFGKI